MATSLRDIPGAGGRGVGLRRRRRDPWRTPVGRAPQLLLEPRFGGATGRRRGPRRGRRWPLSGFDTLLVGTGLLVLLFLLNGVWRVTRVDVRTVGLDGGRTLTFEKAETLAVDLHVRPLSRLAAARLTFDGEALASAERTAWGFRWRNDRPMTVGSHVLELSVPRPVLAASVHRWRFDVDATPPAIRTARQLRERGMHDPVHITGQVDTDAVLTANDEPVKLDHDGRFELSYKGPPAGGIWLRAVDKAGYKVTRVVATPVKRPRVRGVHISAAGWASKDLRAGVLKLITEHKINAVELDVKDESGEVGYRSNVALAKRDGATATHYFDLDRAVADLHRRGVRVVARIVAFRDPKLAAWAWANGHRDWVVQTPDGQALGAYGGFTSFSSDDVVAYNLALAKEAVDAGVDEVLWDYVRRPEGDLQTMVFPKLRGSPEDGVVSFLRRAQVMLRARGVYQGASVFGIASLRPETIAQNIPDIARFVDYLAPMVYPSLWKSGEHHIADPPRQPFDIVKAALADFQLKSAGTGVHMTPWLQDFSLDGVYYRDTQVRQQIRAAQERNIQDWMLWSPRVRYHTGQILTVSDDRF